MPATTPEDVIRKDLQILGTDIWNIAMDHSASIVPLWYRAMRKRRSRPILIDPAGRHVNGYEMIRLCHHFGKKIKSLTRNDQNVGFMLPTSRDAALGIMSILGCGKTTVNLNYTSPVDTLIGCIDKAELSTIVTSRAFFEKLCGKNPDFKQLAEKCQIAWDGKDIAGAPLLIKAKGKCTTDHISMAGPWLNYRGHLENISNNMLIGAVNAFNGETNKVLCQCGEYKEVPELAKIYKAKGTGSIVIG